MPELLIYVKGAEASRKKVRFSRERLVVGRGKSCDMTLGHGTLSRQHLQIHKQDEQWYLQDLGSSNGTRLNGSKISETMLLNNGDCIAAGRVRILVRGIAGGQTAIIQRSADASSAGEPASLTNDDLGLGDLEYEADDFLGSEDLAAVQDDDDMDFQSLDLDGDDAEFAEIELDTMVRTASQLDMPIPSNGDDSSSSYQAWDDLFGAVDDEVQKG